MMDAARRPMPLCRSRRADNATQLGGKRRIKFSCGFDNPVAVKQQRRNAGETTASFFVAWRRRPAHDAYDERAVTIENRGAGISRAAAQSDPLVLGGNVNQTDLEGARRAGHCEGRHARQDRKSTRLNSS